MSAQGAWARFGRVPSARAGLYTLVGLACVALLADVLASDLPLLARVDGRLYVLPCVFRPAALAADDNQGLRARAELLLAPPVPYGPTAQKPGGVTAVLEPPSSRHLLGTDDRGRDVLARLIHGTRVAFTIGPLAVCVYLALGLLVGVLAALGRAADLVVSRAIEVGLTFPTLFVLLAIQGLTGRSSLVEVALAIALTMWPTVARLTRAEALKQVASPHVEAARAVGASPLRIGLCHVLPLAAQPALTAAAFGLAQAVLFESALTFLGFGVPPPTPSWGELLNQAQASGLRWWLLAPPALAIATLVAAAGRVADGVRALVSAPA